MTIPPRPATLFRFLSGHLHDRPRAVGRGSTETRSPFASAPRLGSVAQSRKSVPNSPCLAGLPGCSVSWAAHASFGIVCSLSAV